MGIDITPDMVHQLWDYTHQTQRPESTGLVLTDRGWATAVWTETDWHGPVGMTGADVLGWHDSDEYDPDAGEALAAGPNPTVGVTFKILDEYGNLTEPEDGAAIAVALPAGEPDDQEAGWEGAFWFYVDEASREVEATIPQIRSSRHSELWRTPGGRWVKVTDSARGGRHVVWTEVSHEEAAQMAYLAEPGQVPIDDHTPPLIRAARAARELADAVDAPAIRMIDTDPGRTAFRLDEAAAIDTVHTARAIGALVRGRVQAELRDTRATAAHRLVRAVGDDQGKAARLLGMDRTTLNKLLNSATYPLVTPDLDPLAS